MGVRPAWSSSKTSVKYVLMQNKGYEHNWNILLKHSICAAGEQS